MRRALWMLCLIGMLAGYAHAETVSPTTGRMLEALPAAPVAVSVGHWKDAPQWGLHEADVLYESLLSSANGGQTRMTALYHDALAEGRRVYAGPVRSVRDGMRSLSEEWGAGLVFTGTVAGNENAAPGLRELGGRLLPLNTAQTRAFGIRAQRREGLRIKAPNHMSADVTGLHAALTQRAPALRWRFDAEHAAGEPAQQIRLVWGDEKLDCGFLWQDGAYQRFWDGKPHMTFHSHEDLTQSRLAFDNVIIQLVTYDWPGGSGWLPMPRLTGRGRAVIFSQGRVTEGSWERPDEQSPTLFRDASGAQAALTPGKTYIAHFPADSGGVSWE